MKISLSVAVCVLALQTGFSQKVETVKLSDLQATMLEAEAPLTIFNFWATWCGPCIKELPHFDNANTSNEDVQVYFVSVDFKSNFDKVEKLVAKKGIQSDVLFLDEQDPDKYLRSINADWSGAIPATLFVTDLGKTYFHEKAFTEEDLKKTINEYLK